MALLIWLGNVGSATGWPSTLAIPACSTSKSLVVDSIDPGNFASKQYMIISLALIYVVPASCAVLVALGTAYSTRQM